MPLGLKEENRGLCQWGWEPQEQGEEGPFQEEEQHVLLAKEEHGNSLMRKEWRVCGAAKNRLQKAGRPSQKIKRSGVSIRKVGLHPQGRGAVGREKAEEGERGAWHACVCQASLRELSS